jgi:hypothetical protein
VFWIAIYAGLAVATLVVLGMVGWQVFKAVKKLGLTVNRSQQRVTEVVPPLVAALAELEASQSGRQPAHAAAGAHAATAGYATAGSVPSAPAYASARTGYRSRHSDPGGPAARWESIYPAPWTTDGRQGGRHRADPRG